MILSFDLFGTLIERDVTSPYDIFKLFLNEDQYNIRISSERALKSLYKDRYNIDEITLEEIWKACLNSGLFYSNSIEYWMELEMGTEYQHLHFNPIFRDIIMLPTRKIFVTDMYLPYSFFKFVLKKFNIELNTYNRLYVSGELGLSKQTGRIWKYIYDDLITESNNDLIFHIGDNYDVDVLTPVKQEVVTCYYKKGMTLIDILNLDMM